VLKPNQNPITVSGDSWENTWQWNRFLNIYIAA